jgi:hypothetical protein
MRYAPAYDYDEVPDEFYEEQHRQRTHRKLMSLPPGHPDEPEDSSEENEGDTQ